MRKWEWGSRNGEMRMGKSEWGRRKVEFGRRRDERALRLKSGPGALRSAAHEGE